MRVFTVNIFLLGIGIWDLIRMICEIYLVWPTISAMYIRNSDIPGECLGPDYYLTLVAFLFCVPTRTMAVQMSVWYGVTIALLRALVMRNPMNLRISSLAESKNGIRVLLIITFLYSPFWIIGYFQNYIDEFEVWIPPPYCSNLVENYTRMEYIIKDIKIFGLKEEDIYQKSLVARGILCELIPCILLPIFTFLLIFELQKARKSAMGNSTIDRDRSTKLVIGITVTFLISYGPLAICHLVEFYFFEHDKLVFVTRRLSLFFKLLTILNGIFHFLFCFFMSYAYRKTAKELLRIKEKTQINLVNVSSINK
ncbi:Protein CBG24951 [Caenorhabditis briggsae]|uniref:Protein CBG24951 n=1 Tax=Caenorhabditis briggsae TaxID=6238 RepID=A8WLU0_CAEBR|nr:Protein CBG24951 [Caenorhabditis briggsae]CAP21437.2 Protein CBG24951 [Caenorhabditis briggsae]